MRSNAVLVAFLLVAVAIPRFTFAQSVGDTVRLQSPNPKGVPVHPDGTSNQYWRWANGTRGVVQSVHPTSGWFEVKSGTDSGWIVGKYLSVETTEDESPEAEALTRVIASWNLEHFKLSGTRGFPENTRGGPTYGPRIAEHYRDIAEVISVNLGASIVVLNEVDGESIHESRVLDRVIEHLGSHWKYRLSANGDPQRIAILWNTDAVDSTRCRTLPVEGDLEVTDGSKTKKVFDRKPIACHFRLLDETGMKQNDLLVVGVHLASGQHLVNNHNRAMKEIRKRIPGVLAGNSSTTGEKDILIAGDYNANRYDDEEENFWDNYDPTGFQYRTLSPASGDEYPATRLSGHPLGPKQSKIDYIMASALPGGLVGAELTQSRAVVHMDLATERGYDTFRLELSDHVPLTVAVRVLPDDD